MSRTTDAELANTLAIRCVRGDIARYRMLAWIPRYATLLAVRRRWLALLEAREGQLGEGARGRRKPTLQPVPMLEDVS